MLGSIWTIYTMMTVMNKSSRNKTISTSIDEGHEYLQRCIEVNKAVSFEQIDNKTILGNTFDVLHYLPIECVDLLVVDPPYNLEKMYGSVKFSKMGKADYKKFTYEWLSLVSPLLKVTGSIYVCCDWESSLIIGETLQDFFTVRNRITWQREKGRGASRNWKNNMEDIWFATKSDDYTFNLEDVMIRRKVVAPYKDNGQPKDWFESSGVKYRDTCPSNFWDDITVPFWSMPENTAHPVQKPEKLIAKLILASSNKGDVVLDPFLGSGTTSVVAKKLGRHYIGIEKESQYCIWTEQRLKLADKDKKIQGYEDGIFWERHSTPSESKIQGDVQMHSMRQVHKFF